MFLLGKKDESGKMTWVAVGQSGLVPPGRSLVVEANGLRVLLCNSSAGLTAVESICSHLALPLDKGRIIGDQLICPHHGARFDLKNGCPLAGAALRPLRTFQVAEREGAVWVYLPVENG